jgi:hypothetical protein
LIHWKEAWLRRVGDSSSSSTAMSPVVPVEGEDVPTCTSETLTEMTRRPSDSGEELFSCQATEMLRATSELPWWKLGQYASDVRSRNASVAAVVRDFSVGVFNRFQEANARIAPRLKLVHDGGRYPFVDSRLTGATPPSSDLGLQPGDLVEVRSREEIFATLNENDRNRGLRFDGEMLKYCGRRGRVRHRIERIIDEKTGQMLPIKTDCIVIDGFVCPGDFHRSCPRASYLWWREIWLKRVEMDDESGSAGSQSPPPSTHA